MNRHVGASFTLSVLFVIFFAIILYEPDQTRPTPKPTEPSTPAPTSASAATSPPPSVPASPPSGSGLPTVTPDIPPVETNPKPLLTASRPPTIPPKRATVRATPSPSPSPAPAPRIPPARPTPAPASPSASPRIAVRRPLSAPGPRSAFTQAEEGETLADVSLRVYGTSEAATALWRANRDVIPRREAPLTAGLLLRTP